MTTLEVCCIITGCDVPGVVRLPHVRKQVRPDDRILTIKEWVAQHTSLPVEMQHLTKHGIALKNDRTVRHYKLEDQDVLRIEKRGADYMKLFLTDVCGRTLPMGAWPGMSVFELEQQVYIKTGIPPGDLSLTFEGRLLQNVKLEKVLLGNNVI